MLRNLLDAKLGERRLSVRAAAKEIGVAHTTLNRVLAGGEVDLDTVVKISTWLNIRPAALLGIESNSDTDALLDAVPGLRDILKEIGERIAAGELGPEYLEDVTAYMRFRIGEHIGKRREQQKPDISAGEPETT